MKMNAGENQEGTIIIRDNSLMKEEKLGKVLIAACSFLIAIITLYGITRDDPISYAFVSILMIVLLIPTLKSLQSELPQDICEPIFIILIFYFLYFGFRSVYLDYNNADALRGYWGSPPTVLPKDIHATLLLVIVGVLFMLVFYYLPVARNAALRAPSLRTFSKSINSLIPAYLIVIIGLICKMLLFRIGYGTAIFADLEVPVYLYLLQTLSSLASMGISLIICVKFSRNERFGVIPILLILMYFIISIFAGWKSLLFQIFWLLIIPYNYFRKRVSVKKFILFGTLAVFATVIFIFPVFGLYRKILPNENYVIFKSFGRAYQEAEYGNLATSFRDFSNRLSGLDSLVILYKGGSKGRAFGYTFLVSASSLIPRFIWHNKPYIDIGKLFGVIYMNQPTNVQNSYAVTNIGELYWNFGFMGIILGMAALGFIYRFIYEYFFRFRNANGVFLYAIIFGIIINIESAISTSIVKIVVNIFVALLVIWLCHIFGFLFLKGNGQNY